MNKLFILLCITFLQILYVSLSFSQENADNSLDSLNHFFSLNVGKIYQRSNPDNPRPPVIDVYYGHRISNIAIFGTHYQFYFPGDSKTCNLPANFGLLFTLEFEVFKIKIEKFKLIPLLEIGAGIHTDAYFTLESGIGLEATLYNKFSIGFGRKMMFLVLTDLIYLNNINFKYSF